MTTSTQILTGLALSPKVQIKIQILHHVSELVVVRVLSELTPYGPLRVLHLLPAQTLHTHVVCVRGVARFGKRWRLTGGRQRRRRGRWCLLRLLLPLRGFIGFAVSGEGGVGGWRFGEQRGSVGGALVLVLTGGTVVVEGGGQRALVAVLVVELVVPLQDELAGSQRLGGWLGGGKGGGKGGGLEEGLGLAVLPGEVAGAGLLRGAQGGVSVGEARGRGGGLEALVRFLPVISVVERGAAGEEGPGRGRRGRDDGVVRLEGHPAAGDVFGGESDWRKGVGELHRGRDETLERWRRRGALGGRRRDGF